MIRKNTLIKTANGDKYIQDITDADLILSYNVRTGMLCYNPPLMRTVVHVNGPVALIAENGLYLAKLACVMDYNANEEMFIDGQQVMTSPGIAGLQTIDATLTPHPATVSYTICDDDFYSFVVEDTDIYFANGVMMSNGSSTMFIKDNYTFLKEDARYARQDARLPDANVERLFDKFHVPESIIMHSPLKLLSQALIDAKKDDTNHFYYQRYFGHATLLLANLFVGERTIWK